MGPSASTLNGSSTHAQPANGGREPLPSAYWEHHFARSAAIPDLEWRIPGLLPVGFTVLVAPPKIGKTWLAQQIEHYLTLGSPLFGHTPKTLMNTLAVDLEGHLLRTRSRSLTLAPRLPIDAAELHTDTMYVHSAFDGAMSHADKEYRFPNYSACAGAGERIAWLDSMLTAMENYGKPAGHVRIDTLRLFLGSKPPTMNAYDFDAVMGRRLDELAQRRNISILGVHHTRKSSDDSLDWLERVSGSTGIAGSASGIWLLERNRGSSEGVLRAALRDGEELESPVTFEAGRWAFTDEITPAQARHTGLPRKILDALAAHPALHLREIEREIGTTKEQNGQVRGALDRLSQQGEVILFDGLWRMVDTPAVLRPATELPGQISLPVPAEPEAAPGPPRDPPEVEGDPEDPEPPEGGSEDPEPERVESGVTRAIGVLAKGIDASKSHTAPLIARGLRADEPWSLDWMTEASTGRHHWRHVPGVPRGAIVILDRNGAYPSAMSAVSVASAGLTRTGAVPYTPKRAGLYRLDFDPDDLPNPSPLGLGRPGQWYTAPHVALLTKLQIPYTIDDSWTGRATTKLFEPFYKWARELRSQTSDDPKSYAETKRHVSMAIRSLHWSKPNRLWRPDWYTAIVAEANVRHWVGARKAMEQGRNVVALGGTDEVTLWFPDPLGGEDVEPYRVGTGYGEVKIKASLPIGTWIANGHRAELPKTRHGQGR